MFIVQFVSFAISPTFPNLQRSSPAGSLAQIHHLSHLTSLSGMFCRIHRFRPTGVPLGATSTPMPQPERTPASALLRSTHRTPSSGSERSGIYPATGRGSTADAASPTPALESPASIGTSSAFAPSSPTLGFSSRSYLVAAAGSVLVPKERTPGVPGRAQGLPIPSRTISSRPRFHSRVCSDAETLSFCAISNAKCANLVPLLPTFPIASQLQCIPRDSCYRKEFTGAP